MKSLITDHLDIWTAAHKTRSTAGRGSNNKLDLYGIKKLRELILELAVRGKLVSQDPNDVPASELVKRISAEKSTLIKEGRIKKEISFVNFDGLDEIKKPLPDSWSWIRLSDTADIVRGGSPRPAGDPKFYGGSIPFLKVGDVTNNKGKYVEGFNATITEAGLTKTRYINTRTVLLSNSGATLGIPAICTFPTTFNDGIAAFVEKSACIFDEYLYLYLKSISKWLLHVASQGQGQPNLNTDIVKSVWFSLPPMEEQHRIVAKVDELMAFCDQLEQTQSDNIAAHAQLVEVLLASLTNSSDHTELQNNWQRIAAHFDTLFTTEHSIDQLKQTILQLAVMGKLVPQNPNDEPASELLKKIAAEKAQLIKEGKIKKEKPLPEITDEEKPFELPSGWEWCRLGGITNYGASDKAEPSDVDAFTWVLELEDVEKGTSLVLQKVRYKDRNFKSTKNRFKKNDVIYGKLRPYLDKVLVADEDGVCSTEMIPIRGYLGIFPEYLRLMMKSPKFIEYATESTHGMSLPRLGTEKAVLALIPLCSLSEQHRVVAKVDELMTLCDTLKANLQYAQATQLALADALVESVIGVSYSPSVSVKNEELPMEIRTSLELNPNVKLKTDAVLANIISAEEGSIDAKRLWQKSKMDLPSFYKQLKREISAGYIIKPAVAEIW